ncbi:MAG: hypothetical protein NZZ60_07625 [Bacteroidia bacterium]|nr:hypothetical protein [Bacteroidia bacterium]MCX7652659.1 hypothetical protein [Bacteroidia bacterium]MDW8416987.1 hypothetical protein [Bacteroidia bacterium]
MQSLWLRYIKLLTISLEARFELALGKWAARLLTVILLVSSLAVTLLLLTAAVVTWAAGAVRWGYGFLIGAGLWAALSFVVTTFGHSLLRRQMISREAIYRLRLAQSGMRLIERSLSDSPGEKGLLPGLMGHIGRLLWSIVKQWLRKWVPFL